jgi:hypothetical protein
MVIPEVKERWGSVGTNSHSPVPILSNFPRLSVEELVWRWSQFATTSDFPARARHEIARKGVFVVSSHRGEQRSGRRLGALIVPTGTCSRSRCWTLRGGPDGRRGSRLSTVFTRDVNPPSKDSRRRWSSNRTVRTSYRPGSQFLSEGPAASWVWAFSYVSNPASLATTRRVTCYATGSKHRAIHWRR